MKITLLFLTFWMVSCNQATDILYVNSHSNRVLHSPSIDKDGNILFASSILTNVGYWVDSTKWYLFNQNTGIVNPIPITADHAFLSLDGKHLAFTNVGIYTIKISDLDEDPIQLFSDILDTLSPTYVLPVISNNGDHIYSRFSVYEFYVEDASFFSRSTDGIFSLDSVSAEHKISTDYAYFTPSGKYLVTCGSSIGSETPVGISIYNLINSKLYYYADDIYGVACYFDEERNVLESIDLILSENFNTGYVYQNIHLDSDNIITLDTLDNKKNRYPLFNNYFPQLSFLSNNKLIVYDTNSFTETVIDSIEDFSFQAGYFPKFAWIPNTKKIVVTTDKYLKVFSTY